LTGTGGKRQIKEHVITLNSQVKQSYKKNNLPQPKIPQPPSIQSISTHFYRRFEKRGRRKEEDEMVLSQEKYKTSLASS